MNNFRSRLERQLDKDMEIVGNVFTETLNQNLWEIQLGFGSTTEYEELKTGYKVDRHNGGIFLNDVLSKAFATGNKLHYAWIKINENLREAGYRFEVTENFLLPCQLDDSWTVPE